MNAVPTYTYTCLCVIPCKVFEEQRRIADRDEKRFCPSCWAEVRRVPDAPSIAFRGSGFYVNDYPKGGVKRHD